MEFRIAEGKIEEVRLIDSPIERSGGGSATLPFVSPGFFDIQVNGYRGTDYGYGRLKEEGLREVLLGLAVAGTTRHLATVITNPAETVFRRMEFFRKAVKRSPLIRRGIAGIHLEGPFISAEEGPRGAHDVRYVRDPDILLFKEWQEASGGLIKMITLAPERRGAIPFIEEVSAAGVLCALGHTAADGETLEKAVRAGARLSTHLGNGSRSELPRLENYIWQQLGDDRLAASLICDGYHVPESAVRVISRAKGGERLVLISDSTGITGKAPGRYLWGDIEVELCEDGHIVLSGTPYLAGAGFLLDWDIPRLVEFLGWSVAEAVRCCTATPDRLLGGEPGRIEAGAPADFTLFRYEAGDQRLRVELTVCGGEELYIR